MSKRVMSIFVAESTVDFASKTMKMANKRLVDSVPTVEESVTAHVAQETK